MPGNLQHLSGKAQAMNLVANLGFQPAGNWVYLVTFQDSKIIQDIDRVTDSDMVMATQNSSILRKSICFRAVHEDVS